MPKPPLCTIERHFMVAGNHNNFGADFDVSQRMGKESTNDKLTMQQRRLASNSGQYTGQRQGCDLA
jgi:hypothetical protein